MTVQICKSFISLSLKNSSHHLHKPQIPFFSFSLLFSSSSSQTTEIANYLLHRHQFSPETASKLSLLVKSLKHPEKTDSVLSFLNESGFSKTHIENLIQRLPQILNANLDKTIKPKFKVFLELGFSRDDIVEIIYSDPWILTRSACNRVGPSILLLRRVLGSNVDVSRVLKTSGWFLKHDLEKTMVPNIEFMKSCGISLSQITNLVFSFPRFFLYKTETIKEFVIRVDEMGFDRKSKMFLHAIRTVGSMTLKNWELKLELFRDLGFSEDDILSVFRRVPQVFAVSGRKLKESTELFLSAGKCDLSFLVKHPELLICSIEKRLKPRLLVLEILEKKNLIIKRPALATLFKYREDRFLEKYVVPYSDDVGELYNMANKGS